jgi:hypothetical protein
MHVERVILPMRLRPRRVHPGDALRDEPMCSRCKGGGNEVVRSLATHAGIAPRPFSHPGGIKTGWEIGQLMQHDIRPGSGNGAGQRGRVENVDDYGLDAGRTQRIRFGCGAGGANDMVPRVEQQGDEALANGTGGSSQEDLHDVFLP